jgi:hypothetical protein
MVSYITHALTCLRASDGARLLVTPDCLVVEPPQQSSAACFPLAVLATRMSLDLLFSLVTYPLSLFSPYYLFAG